MFSNRINQVYEMKKVLFLLFLFALLQRMSKSSPSFILIIPLLLNAGYYHYILAQTLLTHLKYKQVDTSILMGMCMLVFVCVYVYVCVCVCALCVTRCLTP